MLTLTVRSVIIYVLVLVVFRLMGKRQLGQMQPFELVLTLILADIATIPMTEISVPILHGIVPLLTLLIIHYVITLLSRISIKFSELISGKTVIVINQDGIDYNAVKRLNLTIDDIFEALRSAGYFSFDQVLFAIMETNGKMSVLPKAQASPVVKEDLKINGEENSLPITIISEGKLNEEAFKQIEIPKPKVVEYIKSLNISKKNILILTLDNNGIIYLQERYKKSKAINSNLKGGN